MAGLHNCKWVVKKYLQAAVDNIEAVKQTVEQHTKKASHMMLVHNCITKTVSH